MRIYAVSTGTHSDYGIEQLFLTREKALAYIKSREAENRWGDFQIETYDTYDERIETADGYLDNVYMTCAVCYDLENEGHWYIEPYGQRASYEYIQPRIQEFYNWRDRELLKVRVGLTAKPQLTDDQIIKVAQDEYAKWKAEKEDER